MAAESITMLLLSKIRFTGETQSRVQLDSGAVADYAERIRAGDEFPPVVVYYDGAVYWPGEGYHRGAAHKQAGRLHIAAVVRKGTRRDAILHSVSSNLRNAVRLTGEDKRRAIQLLLDDPEWRDWPNTRIAALAGATEGTVRNMKKELLAEAEAEGVANYETAGGDSETESDTDPDDNPVIRGQLDRLCAKMRRRCALIGADPQEYLDDHLRRFPAAE